ncbi:MAG: ribonuclease III domain-containing protein [Candidatus Izemoplasmatales bacterium]|jgi:ribonuclease-3 family protein
MTLNGLALAYIGDAYFELKIREHLIASGLTKVNDLHHQAIRYTSALGQAQIMTWLLERGLTDSEMTYYKRGRNAGSTHKPKNADLATYRHATGFEALFGYLYLENEHQRIDQIITEGIAYIEGSSK